MPILDPQNTVGQAVVKDLKSQNARCFNCGNLGHLRKDCYHSVTQMDASSEHNPSLNPQEFASDVGEINTGLPSVDQREMDTHGHPLPWETGLALRPVANSTSYR